MSRIKFLAGLCECVYMVEDLESMKNKSQAVLNTYDEQIRESRGSPIDKLIQQGHKQKSLEAEILERLIIYAHDLNNERIEALIESLGATTNEYSNAIPEHIDERINKVSSKIYDDDTPGSNGSKNYTTVSFFYV